MLHDHGGIVRPPRQRLGAVPTVVERSVRGLGKLLSVRRLLAPDAFS